MAETPFSFHCMICFEEFHADERYPVVLPCGHTYVCNICADRLDKCMECRTPLFSLITAPGPKQAPDPLPAWSSRAPASHQQRVQQHQHPPNPASVSSVTNPKPPIKKRLPLPKNVVLLSLIEATELCTEDAAFKSGSSPKNEASSRDENEGDIPRVSSIISVAEDEEEKIKLSTSLTVGVAGTYAVAAKDGLEIYPSRPSAAEASAATDEDVDTLVHFFHLDQEEDKKDSVGDYQKKVYAATLSYGDRVQIVSLDGGWAKLGRGYGYVRADHHQLVKVGGTVDRACKLEAMLRTLSNRRKELRKEQSKVDNQFIQLMKELQSSLHIDEDLTVIVADVFTPISSQEDDAAVTMQKADSVNSFVERREETNERDDLHKPVAMERQITPPIRRSRNPFVCFAGDVFGDDDNYSVRDLFTSVSHPSPSAMRAGAQAWRDQQAPDTLDNRIDFRTGMSGHMGIFSTHAHPHEFLETNPSMSSFGGFPRMSSHTGLSTKISKTVRTIIESMTMQSPPNQDGVAGVTEVPRAGSM